MVFLWQGQGQSRKGFRDAQIERRQLLRLLLKEIFARRKFNAVICASQTANTLLLFLNFKTMVFPNAFYRMAQIPFKFYSISEMFLFENQNNLCYSKNSS